MTDPGPFAPPSGALPPKLTDSAVPAIPSAPVLPPPTGLPSSSVPPQFTPPVLPPPPPPRRWLIPVVVGGGLVVAALVAGVAFTAVRLAETLPAAPLAGPVDDGEPDDLMTGDPGSPVAAEPLECGECFDLDDVDDLVLPWSSYQHVGVTDADGRLYQTTAHDDQADNTEWWATDGGTPDSCYFTYPRAPLYFAPGTPEGAGGALDSVYYPYWHLDESEYYSLTEAVRVFGDTATASAYLADLETAIDGCTDYSLPDTGWAARVAPSPALDLPDGVAAYGWTESGGYNRFYAIDLQYGNLVVRLTLNSDGYGPTEAQFRQFAEEYAVVLAELEPVA